MKYERINKIGIIDSPARKQMKMKHDNSGESWYNPDVVKSIEMKQIQNE